MIQHFDDCSPDPECWVTVIVEASNNFPVLLLFFNHKFFFLRWVLPMWIGDIFQFLWPIDIVESNFFSILLLLNMILLATFWCLLYVYVQMQFSFMQLLSIRCALIHSWNSNIPPRGKTHGMNKKSHEQKSNIIIS